MKPLRRVRRSIVVVAAGAAIVTMAAAAVVVVGPRGHTRRAQASSEVVEIHAAHGASFVPALEGKRPLFILALGSDARPGEGIEHNRADSIHLIGVNVNTRQATILGFPRDSWVRIPGHGTTKINTAMTFGGPDLMVQTIESITGIPIDFWLLTSFSGIRNMVDRIGGLNVRVPTDMHDSYSGANFKKGMQHLNGKEALAFARDRHDVPGGDLGRSANQGRLMLSALGKLRSTFDKDAAELLDWIGIGWSSIHTDLGFPTVLALALTATSIPPANVDNLVVPASTGTVGTASVVFISSAARSIYDDMRADGVVG